MTSDTFLSGHELDKMTIVDNDKAMNVIRQIQLTFSGVSQEAAISENFIS